MNREQRMMTYQTDTIIVIQKAVDHNMFELATTKNEWNYILKLILLLEKKRSFTLSKAKYDMHGLVWGLIMKDPIKLNIENKKKYFYHFNWGLQCVFKKDGRKLEMWI